MGVGTLAAFALLELTLCLIPGPAVLFVLATATWFGTRAGLTGAAGIVGGNTVYFLLSACGLAALLLASPQVFLAVKWCGLVYLAYLAYLGARALLGGGLRARIGDEAARGASGRTFSRALLTQLSNPKAIVFFVAVLPQFVDPHGRVWLQFAILALLSAFIEFSVLAGYTLAGARLGAARVAR